MKITVGYENHTTGETWRRHTATVEVDHITDDQAARILYGLMPECPPGFSPVIWCDEQGA